MATFLDVGILEKFSIIFVFLLVFTIIYAVLEYSNPFGGGKKGLHAIIALAVAFLIVISKPAVIMVNFMTPWFLVLFLFIFFILFSVRMFGTSEADTIAIIKDARVYPYLIVFAIVIIIAGFSYTFGQTLLEERTGIEGVNAEKGEMVLPGDIEGGSTKTISFSQNVLNTVVHPKVLGFIAIMLVGLFTLIFLTKLT